MSFESAQKAYEEGDIEKARQLLAEVLSKEPNNASAWLLQMQVAERDVNREAAMKRVLELNPAHPMALAYQKEILRERVAPLETEAEAEPPRGESTFTADGTRVTDLGTYEMLWDCEFCGTKGLLGKTHRFCGNCGAQQNPEKRYFPSDEEKVRVEDHVFVGVDVTCSTCQTLNSAAAEFCTNCATPLKEHGVQAKRLDEQTRGADETFEFGGSRDLVKEEFESAQTELPKAKRRRILGLPVAVFGGITALVTVCIGIFGVLVFATEEATVTVSGHSWEREIQIEVFAARSDGDWCDSMPSDAYDISRSERQRSTRRVQDGETCSVRRIDNGDGTFSEREECRPTYRNEPVYDDYCDYTIDRWGVDRSVIESGSGFASVPFWPQLNLTAGSGFGAEREGERSERYIVQFRRSDSGDTYECSFENEARWREFAPDSAWTIEVGRVAGDARCGSLAPAG